MERFNTVRTKIEAIRGELETRRIAKAEREKAEDEANLERFPDFPHLNGCLKVTGIRISTIISGGPSMGSVLVYKSASCLDCKVTNDSL